MRPSDILLLSFLPIIWALDYPDYWEPCLNNTIWKVVDCRLVSCVPFQKDAKSSKINQTDFAFSNCHIINGPPMVMGNYQLKFENMVFEKVSSGATPTYMFQSSDIKINNVTFDGISLLATESNATLSDSWIKNAAYAKYYGALVGMDTHFQLFNVHFYNNTRSFEIYYGGGKTTNLTWIGGSSYSEVQPEQGNFMLCLFPRYLRIENVKFYGPSQASYGDKTAIQLQSSDKTVLKNIELRNMSGLVNIDLDVVSVQVENMVASNYGLSGRPFFTVRQNNEQSLVAKFKNLTIENFVHSTSGWVITAGAQVEFDQVRFTNYSINSKGRVPMISNGGTLSFTDSIISQSHQKGVGSYIDTLVGAQTVFRNSVMELLTFNGKGGAFSSAGRLEILGDSSFRNITASYGAVVSSQAGNVQIKDTATFINNTALNCGGVFYLAGPVLLNVSSTGLIQHNHAKRGSWMCFDTAFQSFNTIIISQENGKKVAGSVWLPSRQHSALFSARMSQLGIALGKEIQGSSVPVSIAFSNSSSGPLSQSVQVNAFNLLPALNITLLDFFNNTADTVIENGEKVPVIYWTPINTTSALDSGVIQGETSKISLQGRISFDELLVNAANGTFQYKIQAYPGAVDYDETVQWPSLNVSIIPCDTLQNRLIIQEQRAQCYKLCPIPRNFSLAFGILGALFLAASFVAFIAWLRYDSLLKAEQTATPLLSSVSVLGNMIAFIGLVVGLGEWGGYCDAWNWLWNIGYYTSLFSLAAKPLLLAYHPFFKISKRDKEDAQVAAQVASFTSQTAAVILPLIVIIIGLVIWTVIDRPHYTDVLTGNCVVTNACASRSAFPTLNTVIRLIVVGLNALVAVIYRSANGIEREIKSISFVAYNWVVFEIILVVLYNVLSKSPSAQYFIVHICTLLPHGMTVLMLLIKPLVLGNMDIPQFPFYKSSQAHSSVLSRRTFQSQ